MGLENLEEKFQIYKRNNPQNLAKLKSLAHQISKIQKQIRNLLSDVTPALCSACETKCCTGMPIDGWFTAEDYCAYRMLYEAPHRYKAISGEHGNCSFLSLDGCSLPEDMRPLACVKVNCEKLNTILKAQGKISVFKQYCEALDDIQVELWKLVDGQEGQ